MRCSVRAVITLVSVVLLANSCFADYTLSVNFLGTGAGRVVVTNNTLGSQIIDTTVNTSVPNVNNTHSLTTLATASTIGISATASNVVAGNALNVSNVYTPQSTLALYQRVNGDFSVFVDPSTDTFTNSLGNPVSLNYTFDLADLFTNAVQFQYFFTIPLPGVPSLNQGNFFTASASTPVPWSAFSALGVGTNRSGTLRVIDAGGRSSSTSFTFDISPSGGPAAVPEPSSLILFSLVAGAGAVGRRFWKKRKAAC